jgi:cephalosporin hydroxylase
MNKVIGFHTYKHATILQHDDIQNVLKDLFSKTTPSQVLEIGTASGGLSLMIRDILDESGLVNSQFRTYDVFDSNRPELKAIIEAGANVDLRIKNVFNHAYSDLQDECVEEIQSFIQQNGTTIVMCDGGSKKNEFNILSQFLKPGDIIMAHDYASTSEYFESHINNKIWNWHEIQDSDIQESVKNYNLEPFMQEEFQKVVWVCKIKK